MPETPKKPKIQPWNGNNYMVCNGVPVAFDSLQGSASKFNGPTVSLRKRGDVRNKFDLGMFDMPSASRRRKGMYPGDPC